MGKIQHIILSEAKNPLFVEQVMSDFSLQSR